MGGSELAAIIHTMYWTVTGAEHFRKSKAGLLRGEEMDRR